MVTSHYLSPYPEDNLQWFLLPWWLKYRDQVVRDLSRGKSAKRSYYGNQSSNLLFYPPELYIMERKMNGRKPKNTSPKSGSANKQPTSLEWVNAPFTDEDIDYLSDQSMEPAVLASGLIGLVGDGYGVSVKFDFERERFNCTIYRSPTDDNRRNLGLSAHAADVWDAVAAALYRFHSKCGGVLNDDTPTASSHQPKRRFG